VKDNQTKILKITLTIAASLVAIMGIVYAYDIYFDLNLYKYGVYPQKFSGLIGILTAPFIHSTSGYSHLLNNSGPTFILTWLLFYNFRNIAPRVFIITFLGTGLLVWIFGRPSYHIGMSGVIYGLTSFLMVSGFLTKNVRVAGISLLVIFLYGSFIWGIFPQQNNVSWEGHFSGFTIGIFLAFFYRSELPQQQKYRYEVEEELGIEPEFEYWNETHSEKQGAGERDQPITPVHNDPIQVVYTFVPKEVKPKLDDHKTDQEEEYQE